jgi:hypothetical protein
MKWITRHSNIQFCVVLYLTTEMNSSFVPFFSCIDDNKWIYSMSSISLIISIVRRTWHEQEKQMKSMYVNHRSICSLVVYMFHWTEVSSSSSFFMLLTVSIRFSSSRTLENFIVCWSSFAFNESFSIRIETIFIDVRCHIAIVKTYDSFVRVQLFINIDHRRLLQRNKENLTKRKNLVLNIVE